MSNKQHPKFLDFNFTSMAVFYQLNVIFITGRCLIFFYELACFFFFFFFNVLTYLFVGPSPSSVGVRAGGQGVVRRVGTSLKVSKMV